MQICDASGTTSTHDLRKIKQKRAVLWHCNCTAADSPGRIVQNATSGSEGVREVLDRILSSYEEIDRRFSTAGGLGSLLNLYEQVRRELERVSYEEIDRMTLEIKSVIEALLKMDYELRKVNNLKLAFDGRAPGTAGSG
jgi:hypothetical protein